jgi:septum formation protein
MENFKINFVLASASPRRKELIGHLKVPFEVLALNVPEESSSIDPVHYSLEIARIKGKAVEEKLKKERPGEVFFIVSADTIVCLGKKIFGKPKNRDEAREFLKELRGLSHSVFTAVSAKLIINGSQHELFLVEESRVTFNDMSKAILERYLDTGDSLDKAGAYGIQGPSLTFISKVEGDYANVVGFPLSRFVIECEKFFKNHFPDEELWLNLF